MAVLLLFLIVDSAVLACCKLKLGAVTQDAAKFTAELNTDSDKEIDKTARKYVEGLLKESRQPYTNLTVKVKRFQISDAEALSVTVEGSYPLVENNLLPGRISLCETAAALIPARKICGYVAISPDAWADPSSQRRPSIYLPIVRPNRHLPVWTFPYDTAIGSLNLQRGTQPDLQRLSQQKTDDYFKGMESIY
jgi:hypothetical protein